MAALNVAGYDAEINSASNHPLRAAVRQQIGERNLPSVTELRRFYQAHLKKDGSSELSPYISWALSFDEEFKPRFKAQEMPPDTGPLFGFDELMLKFRDEADLDTLWKRAQPAYEQALARYHEPVTLALQQVNAYLRVPASGYLGRRFRVYVDLLGPPNQIQSRSYADDYYIVVTNSAEPFADDIRQAYLMFLLDPLATKFSTELSRKGGMIDYAQTAPLLAPQYKGDFLLLATKSLARAIEARLGSAARQKGLADQALAEGFVLIPYFMEALPLYEKQELAMRLYYPDMIGAIDLKREEKRLEGFQFSSTPVVRRAKTVETAEVKPQLTGARKTLEDAEDLYDARKLADARARYLKSLEESADKPLHARAYYGLARIAALEKNPELAQRLFAKVLELQPEPQVKAWSHIYLGRLADLAGEPDEAARNFDAARQVEGATPAAREAARKALAETRKGK